MIFEELFPNGKPIIGMIHHKGLDRADKLRRAALEADLLVSCGVDALMIEDYYGDAEDVERTLRWLHEERPHYCYGVNVLDKLTLSCDLAEKYGAKLVQVDSICGHLSPEDDIIYEKECLSCHGRGSFLLLGGVRFKYKDVLSGRSLETDLKLGMARCDAIVVTGTGTGVGTEISKIREFRSIIGHFPLIIGAGMTPETVKDQLALGDGAIVGSAFKENGKAEGELSEPAVRKFIAEVLSLRNSL